MTQSETVGSNSDNVDRGVDYPSCSDIGAQYFPLWEHFAILRLTEKTSEYKRLSSRWGSYSNYNFVKYRCEILFKYDDNAFWGAVPEDEKKLRGYDGEGFKNEIWLIEEENLSVNEIILINADVIHSDEDYYIPYVDDNGMQYLKFIDGKLITFDGWINTGSFYSIYNSNLHIEMFGERIDLGNKYPKYKLEDGVSLEDTINYFLGIQESYNKIIAIGE